MPPRVPALDRLRAAALVLMLVHHFTKWLAGDPRGVIPGWDGFVVTDVAAPAFTVAAGASAVLFAAKHGSSIATVLRRYGLLVPIGMLVQWLFTSHVPFDWGVLQALGVGVVVSTLVARVLRAPAAMALAATAALVGGPLIEAAVAQQGGWVVDILGGLFPVVTYTGFALAGAAGGLLLARDPDRGMQAIALGSAFAAATVVLILLGMPPDRYPGAAAFVIPGLAGTLLLFGALDRWSAMPAAFGKHTLGIFISHYAVLWVIVRFDLRGSVPPDVAVAASFVAVAAFALVAPLVPPLPWSPRTGWRSDARQNRVASSAA